MICVICSVETNVDDIIKCNGCKNGFHYGCVNITSATFREGQVQIRKKFKCDACLNVTQRVRVTDDTPVRGVRSDCTNNSGEINIIMKKNTASTNLTSDDNIIAKVNSVIVAKLNEFESKILNEIKSTLTVLTLENSKLRQELKESEEKCSAYERDITILKTEKLVGKEIVASNALDFNSEKQPELGDTEPSQPTVSSSPAHASKRAKRIASAPQPPAPVPGPQNPALPPQWLAPPSQWPSLPLQWPALRPAPPPQGPPAPQQQSVSSCYAPAVNQENAIGDTNWIEVRNRKRNNAIRRGGNTSTASLKAVERKKYLHVWRLDKSTSEKNLKDYIESILGSGSEIDIEKLKPKTERDYASFKVGVSEGNFEKLFEPNVWPLNIEYSEWIWFRRSTKSTVLQTQ